MASKKTERPVPEPDPLLKTLHAGDQNRRDFLATLDPRQRAVLSWEGE